MKIKRGVTVWRTILTIIITLMAMRGMGQGTKLSSFATVTGDTALSMVCVSDSGGTYKDKLYPLGLFVTYLSSELSDIISLDAAIANGNTTARLAVWSNGSDTSVSVLARGGGIVMDAPGYSSFYGSYAALWATAGDVNAVTITPLYMDVHNSSDHHGIILDTAIYVTDGGGNASAGFNMNGNMGSMFMTDVTTGYAITYKVGPLTGPQIWWWRNRTDTVAGLKDVAQGVYNADSTARGITDSVAHTCDSVALHYADSVAGGGTLQTVTTAGPTTTNSMYIQGTTPVFSVYNPLTSAQTDLNYQSLKVQGTSGPGHQLYVYDSAICFIQGSTGALMTHSITAGTQWYLPDSSGIIALLSDIPAPHAAGTPSGAYGTGAGTSPGTMTITGSDIGGIITVVTGTSPASGAVIITISYSNSFSAINSVILTPANENAAALYGSGKVFVQTISIFGFTLYTSSPLTGGTTYSWYYHTDGN